MNHILYTAAAEKYGIIYADPPWQYETYSKKGKGRSAENHYPTMPIQEICDLDIPQIADDDCVLFLWATCPMLGEAFRLIRAWGFKYKTVGFVWVKLNKKTPSLFWGLGYWTRANAEICLIATKGKPKRISASVHQVVITPVEQHSKKPDVVRDRIVEVMGDLPRIELFARTKTPGWDVWGNEVISDIDLKGGNPIFDTTE
jgi:N6-adenosine-specific RNA methylase IME4